MGSKQSKRKRDAENKNQYRTLRKYRKVGPTLKKFLTAKGCRLNFYDYLDSYEDEYKKVLKAAKDDLPSLRAIVEQKDYAFYNFNWEESRKKLGLEQLEMIPWKSIDTDDDYDLKPTKGDLTGRVAALRTNDGELATVVFARKSFDGIATMETAFGMKLAVLFHEMGHVIDWENGINLREGDISVLNAEVFAWAYALKRLCDGDYIVTLKYLLEQIKSWNSAGDHRDRISTELMKLPVWNTCLEKANHSWRDYLHELSEDEILEMGADGVKLVEALRLFESD